MNPLQLVLLNFKLHKYGEIILDKYSQNIIIPIRCLVAKSSLTLSTLWTTVPPCCSVYGISQARILEWFTISFSNGSAQPRDRTHVSCIGRLILYC